MAEIVGFVGLAIAVGQLIELLAKTNRRLKEFSAAVDGLPESFRRSSNRLPILENVLKQVGTQASRNDLSEEVLEAVHPLIQDCWLQLEKLHGLIDKSVLSQPSSDIGKRWHAFRSLRYSAEIEKCSTTLNSNLDLLLAHQQTITADNIDQVRSMLASTSLDHLLSHRGTDSIGLYLGEKIPLDRTLFVGRERELNDLSKLLCDQHGDRAILNIVGMRGVGKTQLVLAFAQRASKHFSSIFCMDASSEASLKQSFVNAWRSVSSRQCLASMARYQSDEDAVSCLKAWLGGSTNESWLLILDGYPGLTQLAGVDSTKFDLMHYLPPGSKGVVVVTSCFQRVPYGRLFLLRPLRRIQDGVKLLCQRSGIRTSKQKKRNHNVNVNLAFRRLAIRVGNMPSLLTAGAEIMRQTSMRAEELLKLYVTDYRELVDCAPRLPEYSSGNVFTTHNSSFVQVQFAHLEAAELLRFLAYLGPAAIWFELFSPKLDAAIPWFERISQSKLRFHTVMGILHDWSLVEKLNRGYCLHPAIHDWIANDLNSSINHTYCQVAFRCVAANSWYIRRRGNHGRHVSVKKHSLWVCAPRLRPRIEALERTSTLEEDISNMSHLCSFNGHFGMARQLANDFLKILQSRHKPDNKKMHLGLLALAEAALGEHDLQRAKACFLEMMKLDEGEHGLNSVPYLSSLSNVVLVDGMQGQHAKAYEAAQALYNKLKVEENPQPIVYQTIKRLAHIAYLNQHFEQAREWYTISWKRWQKSSHVGGVRARVHHMLMLGCCYDHIGQYHAAADWYRSILSLAHFLSHHSTLPLDAAQRLAVVYRHAGQHEQALRVLFIQWNESRLPHSHPSLLKCELFMARLHFELGDDFAAKQHICDLLGILIRLVKPLPSVASLKTVAEDLLAAIESPSYMIDDSPAHNVICNSWSCRFAGPARAKGRVIPHRHWSSFGVRKYCDRNNIPLNVHQAFGRVPNQERMHRCVQPYRQTLHRKVWMVSRQVPRKVPCGM